MNAKGDEHGEESCTYALSHGTMTDQVKAQKGLVDKKLDATFNPDDPAAMKKYTKLCTWYDYRASEQNAEMNMRCHAAACCSPRNKVWFASEYSSVWNLLGQASGECTSNWQGDDFGTCIAW